MTENAWNACAVCGEQVTTRARMQGLQWWENAEGEVFGREVVVVFHPECYMRLTPAEREALLWDAEAESRS
jgi:hypothetical protein